MKGPGVEQIGFSAGDDLTLDQKNEAEIWELVKPLSHEPAPRLLVSFSQGCQVNLNCICILTSIYTQSTYSGIEMHFHNAPLYFHHFFPDIPNVELLSMESYIKYQLVLVYEHNVFKLAHLNLNNIGKDIYASA